MLFKRPFSCEYCKHYNSTYLEVTVNHWPVCDSYPVQCPNKCSDEILKRQNLESHIANDYPLAIVDCDFKGVGRLPHKDLCTHFNEGVGVHMSLHTKQSMDLREEKEQPVKGMKQVTEDLVNLREENKQLKQQIKRLTNDLEEYQIGIPLCPVELTMTNFEQHKKDGNTWCSPSFYTHPMGYKSPWWSQLEVIMRVQAHICHVGERGIR